MDHKLTALPKLTPDAATQSGKCSCGARFTAASENELAEQHETHLLEATTSLDRADTERQIAEGTVSGTPLAETMAELDAEDVDD